MSSPDLTIATRYTRSLCRHANKHNLGNTMSSIKPPHHDNDTPYVQIYPFFDADHLASFARWLPTLANVVVTVTAEDSQNLHLLATGAMDDDTLTGVVVLPHGTDRELVEANCHPVVGNEIPVELLLRLVSAAVAESRTDTTALAGAS